MRLTFMRSLFLAFFGSLTFTAPALGATSPDLVGLQRRLTSLIAARPGEYGIAALDLRDGSSVSVNGNISFPMASTVRLPSPALILPKSITVAAS